MGFPWKRIFTFGLSAAETALSFAAPVWGNALISAIHLVEDNATGLKGADKKQAAINIAVGLVQQFEKGVGQDVINDAAVSTATSSFIDLYVAFMNGEAALRAAIDAAKQVKNKTTSS